MDAEWSKFLYEGCAVDVEASDGELCAGGLDAICRVFL
jgi:hypothetical protein